jgi:hypothetical protein
MNRWIRIAIVSLLLGFVVGAGRWASGQTAPQAPAIISGNDIGFRVDRQRTDQSGKLSGSWVVRYNGQWVEPNTSGSRLLSAR